MAFGTACASGVGCSAEAPGSGSSGLALAGGAGSGACVDPHADARKRFACLEGGCTLYDDSPGDLDGDGVADVLVAWDDLCGVTGNCPFFVYLSGAGCAHWAGEVGGVSVSAEATRHAGVRDLGGYWKGGCVAMEGTGSTWAFDGTQYRTIDSYECECPDEDAGPRAAAAAAARDPRCPSID
jgi:hypothetical protein